MLDIILLIIGFAGFGIAGYLDLKNTEFPDLIPYGMIAAILVARAAYSVYSGSFSGLFESVFIGLAFLGVGFALYLLKQWGDGDAWLLGVLGFLLPNNLITKQLNFVPAYFSLLINFFLVSFFYLIAYSAAIGMRSSNVKRLFLKRVRGEARTTIALSAVFLVSYSAIIFYLNSVSAIRAGLLGMYVFFPALVVFVVFFQGYAKAVEKIMFKRKINVKQLRPGDVLVGDRWRGLTKQELRKMRKENKAVWIKEGVRFAPSFLITLVVTLFFGSLLI